MVQEETLNKSKHYVQCAWRLWPQKSNPRVTISQTFPWQKISIQGAFTSNSRNVRYLAVIVCTIYGESSESVSLTSEQLKTSGTLCTNRLSQLISSQTGLWKVHISANGKRRKVMCYLHNDQVGLIARNTENLAQEERTESAESTAWRRRRLYVLKIPKENSYWRCNLRYWSY